jgi:hypothetical protein
MIASSSLPGPVSKIASAKNWVDSARLLAATRAPSVSTVQYTRNRPSLGRAVGTRQMRLNVVSTLVSVISTDATSAIAPAAVSLTVLLDRSRR